MGKGYEFIEEMELLKREKKKKTIEEIVDSICHFCISAIIIISFFMLAYKIDEALTTKQNDELREKISAYEQILEYEYNRTFESFEEYIVYRADKILGE